MEGIQSFSANTYETRSKKPKSGVGSGLFNFVVTSLIPETIVSAILIKRMEKLNGSLTADEIVLIDKAVAKTIEQSGMKQKGLGIIEASAENTDEIKKIFERESELGIFKHLPKPIRKIRELLNKIVYVQLMKGQNACHANLQNKIIIPKNKLRAVLPHEMGHAMNSLLSKSSRILQKCRPLSWLTLPIGLIALFKNKKAEGEKPKNFIDKTTTFIKNHAPALVIASWLPEVAEEGLASIRGYKAVKEFITPDLAKKVMRANILGFTSYVFMSAILAFAVHEASKGKDKAHQISLDKINK